MNLTEKRWLIGGLLELSLSLVLSLAVLASCAFNGDDRLDQHSERELVGDQLASESAMTQSGADAASRASAETGCSHDAKTLRCVKYLKNYDADTITFNVPGVHPLLGEKISVRVNGIDAPEIRGGNDCEKKSARIARNLIESLLKRSRRIDLTNVDRDKYFRILADVRADGKDLKDVLMRNGLAYAYQGGTKKKVDWCAVAKGDGRVPAGG